MERPHENICTKLCVCSCEVHVTRALPNLYFTFKKKNEDLWKVRVFGGSTTHDLKSLFQDLVLGLKVGVVRSGVIDQGRHSGYEGPHKDASTSVCVCV